VQAIEMMFEGGTIDLKDGVFVRCSFKNCLLLVEAGHFLFVGPTHFFGVVRVIAGINKAAQLQILDEALRSEGKGSLVFVDA
jgi:hypothetical protein